ncbi:MAG: tetratricopeptide repeat protein, partial [Thermoguttaceae bacterium]
ALIKTGSLKEAIMHYERALRAKPDYPQVHNNLAGALIMAGRLQEGIEHLKQSLQLMPEDINSWHNLAKAHAMNHQSSEAIAAARKALELARSQGRTEQAQQIENWLNSYRAGPSESPK